MSVCHQQVVVRRLRCSVALVALWGVFPVGQTDSRQVGRKPDKQKASRVVAEGTLPTVTEQTEAHHQMGCYLPLDNQP